MALWKFQLFHSACSLLRSLGKKNLLPGFLHIFVDSLEKL